MSTVAELRRQAMTWAREGWAEPAIAEQLTGILEEDAEASRAVQREWAAKVAADVSAAAIQPSSSRVSRAPAVLSLVQERMPWAELPAQVGYDEMRRYVSRTSAVAARRAIYLEVLAILDPIWQAQALDASPTFGAACAAAGVPAEIVAALAA